MKDFDGHIVYGEPNGCMAFDNRTDVQRCAACGQLLSKCDEPLGGFVLGLRRYDLSQTLDGIQLASRQFVTVVESHGLASLRFTQLPDDPDFFAIQAAGTVTFDCERRQPRMLERCKSCGQYKYVVGATPVFLKEGSSIPDLGFARTDLEFGSEDGKAPLLLCGVSAGKVLREAQLKGVHVLPLDV